ncbi:MAG: hypothetical protein HDR50_03995 [Desulfovibrio sp.]|uniref:hypothetical protein n=1 Tax=Desulfovibrio sp. TaxID=885 RepID=UPI001A6A5FBE|nr:hypothetical protein [Desulfovibrio sp.]MBD5416819.1 hypothetical protein [Desulfovibrio sp.]
MRPEFDPRLWQAAALARKRQHSLGLVSGILLAVALLGLFDGLLAEMRAGTNQLELLPGEGLTLSGPAALKNPVSSDIVARLSPPDAPLRFTLEGFFTGYWFGNGMWRGEVRAEPDAAPGTYGLRVTFRGAVGQAPQVYTLIVHEDAAARREASLSYLRRLLDVNPFVLAALCGGLGVLLGGATYAFGRRHVRLLAELGCSEVYRAAPAGAGLRLWCLAAKAMAPRPGTLCPVLDADGAAIGEARVEQWRKGSLELTLPAAQALPEGSLVCLRLPSSVVENR